LISKCKPGKKQKSALNWDDWDKMCIPRVRFHKTVKETSFVFNFFFMMAVLNKEKGQKREKKYYF